MILLDLVDKQILLELRDDCRVSFENLARKLGLTSNAIKKRILNLTSSGVLENLVTRLSLAMVDARIAMILAHTDGVLKDNEVEERIGSHPLVTRVGFDSSGGVISYAEYTSETELEEIHVYIEGIPGLGDVESYKLDTHRGGSMKLSATHLRVLRCLVIDPRMSVSKIASSIGIKPRRVRRLVQEMWEDKVLSFTAVFNLNKSGSAMFVIRLDWDGTKTDSAEIINEIEKLHQNELWDSLISNEASKMWCVFIIPHIRGSEDISRRVSKIQYINIESVIIPYTFKSYTGLRDHRLAEIIKES